MRLPLMAVAVLGLLPACAEIQTYGAAGIERRRVMNDMQARATLAATCDIALGAYFRELSPTERDYVGLVCGGMIEDEAPARLVAPAERGDDTRGT